MGRAVILVRGDGEDGFGGGVVGGGRRSGGSIGIVMVMLMVLVKGSMD